MSNRFGDDTPIMPDPLSRPAETPERAPTRNAKLHSVDAIRATSTGDGDWEVEFASGRRVTLPREVFEIDFTTIAPVPPNPGQIGNVPVKLTLVDVTAMLTTHWPVDRPS